MYKVRFIFLLDGTALEAAVSLYRLGHLIRIERDKEKHTQEGQGDWNSTFFFFFGPHHATLRILVFLPGI